VNAADQLASHLELTAGEFALLVLVCDGQEQLEDLLGGARVGVRVAPSGKEWALERGRGLLLIDASDAHPAEKEGWITVLRRLNEGRDRLVERWAGPCVLAVPPWMLSLLPSEAPDLWSVRTTVLRSGEAAPPPAEQEVRSTYRWGMWAFNAYNESIRPSMDGVPPSDKVVTLVARLREPGHDEENAALFESFIEIIEPDLSGEGPQVITAATAQIGLAFVTVGVPLSRRQELLDRAIAALRRAARTAPLDLRGQIAWALLSGSVLSEDRLPWLEEAEQLARTLNREQAGMWDHLLVEVLHAKVRLSWRGAEAVALSQEALERAECAERRGEAWAMSRMPELLWDRAGQLALLQGGKPEARELRVRALERLEKLATQDTEAREDLPFWWVRAAHTETEPTRKLKCLEEAFRLWLEQAPSDPQEVRATLGPLLEVSRWPADVRSRVVRTLRELQVQAGSDHPLAELLSPAAA
jgi:hypothetical protein